MEVQWGFDKLINRPPTHTHTNWINVLNSEPVFKMRPNYGELWALWYQKLDNLKAGQYE